MTTHKLDLDQGFLPGRSRHIPVLVSDLLKLLGVAGESAAAQRHAVKHWLKDNTPNKLLRDDLRNHKL